MERVHPVTANLSKGVLDMQFLLIMQKYWLFLLCGCWDSLGAVTNAQGRQKGRAEWAGWFAPQWSPGIWFHTLPPAREIPPVSSLCSSRDALSSPDRTNCFPHRQSTWEKKRRRQLKGTLKNILFSYSLLLRETTFQRDKVTYSKWRLWSQSELYSVFVALASGRLCKIINFTLCNW